MKRFWWLPVAAVLMTGCASEEPVTGNKCKDCGPQKCFRTVKETVQVPEKYVEYKTAEKDCVVEIKKPVVKKVPVKTYRYVEEWVDTEVQIPVSKEITVKSKKKVPVIESYLAYDKVEKQVDGTVACDKKIVTANWKCEHKKGSKDIQTCDVCGKSGKIEVETEYSVPVKECKTTVETAQCPIKVKGTVEEPVMKQRTVMREGFFTDKKTIQEMKTVPGKKLVRRRVCDTVMTDVTEYVTEKKMVKRGMREPVEKTRMVSKCVDKKVQVDCQTGVQIAPATAEKNDGKTPATQDAQATQAPVQSEAAKG